MSVVNVTCQMSPPEREEERGRRRERVNADSPAVFSFACYHSKVLQVGNVNEAARGHRPNVLTILDDRTGHGRPGNIGHSRAAIARGDGGPTRGGGVYTLRASLGPSAYYNFRFRFPPSDHLYGCESELPLSPRFFQCHSSRHDCRHRQHTTDTATALATALEVVTRTCDRRRLATEGSRRPAAGRKLLIADQKLFFFSATNAS